MELVKLAEKQFGFDRAQVKIGNSLCPTHNNNFRNVISAIQISAVVVMLGYPPWSGAEAPVTAYVLSYRNAMYINEANVRTVRNQICTEILPEIWTSTGWDMQSTPNLGPSVSGNCWFYIKRTSDGHVQSTEEGFPWPYGTWCASGDKPDTSKPTNQQCPTSAGNTSSYPGTALPVSALDDRACAVGNPCSTGSGIKRQSETDYIGLGAQPLTLQRLYKTSYLVPPKGGFGPLWMHEWQRRLDLSSYPKILALRSDGSTSTFLENSGRWTMAGPYGDEILLLTDGSGTPTGWQLSETRSGRIEDYDRNGKLTRVRERNGWTLTLHYSDANTPAGIAPTSGLLIDVRSSLGRTLKFTYDGSKRISSIEVAGEIGFRYAYDTGGMLSAIIYSDGSQRTYHYEDSRIPWALTGITDEKGIRFATYGYDSLGRATSTEHAGGVDKFQLSFLGNGQTSVTTADGTSRTFSSELQGNVLRATGASAPCPACGDIAKAVSYDAAGNVATRRDFADKETRYSYDALGRETQRIEGYGTADAKTTTSEWHPTWNLPQKVAAPGRVDYFSYDAKGHVLVYGWYPTNDVTGGQGLNVQPSGDVTSTTWTYDENGLVATAVDKVGDTVTGQWSFAYDAQGNLTTVTNGAGQIGYAVQYDAAGRLLEAVDVNGSRVKYAYDARGRMTDVDIDGIHTRYEYDAVGQLVGVVGPYDLVTRYTYDAAHRLIQILDNITIPEHVTESSPVSPFSVDGEASPSSLAYVSNRLVSGWNAVLRWLKDWLSGIIRSAHAQTTPPLPNSYAPPLRPGQSIPTFPGSSAAVDLDPSLTPEKATPRMYAMQFLVRVQKACGEVLEAVVSAFDKSTPPGDCDDDEYTKLKTNVDQSCKTGQQYCKAGDSPALLVSKRDALQACANARRKIMNVCFRGGDKAHQRDWVKVVQQVDICNGL